MNKKDWEIALGALGTILVVIYLGIVLLQSQRYNVISLIVAFLACLPFFWSFERNKSSTMALVLIAIMVAFSVIGRVVFAPIPGFKPVTAITILVALYFGPQAGFLTGALSAVISNLFFGQGPWTPFQMFAWGLTGFLAGLLRQKLVKGRFWRIWLSLYGAFAGVVYSLLTDIWLVLSFGGEWSWIRYSALILAAIPFTMLYAASNVVFLMALTKPIGDRLIRIKKKYGLEDM